MMTRIPLPLALTILMAGYTAVRDTNPDTRSEPNIPALDVDVNVEVQEAPGLFQGTK